MEHFLFAHPTNNSRKITFRYFYVFSYFFLQVIHEVFIFYQLISIVSNIMGFDVEPAPVIQEKFANAKVQLLTIAKEVQNQQSVYKVTEGRLPWLKSQFISPLFDRFARRTKPFYATSECISCGLCARNCPTQTIKLIDGKPHWGDHCYQCTACINHCPVQAIQFGKSTIPRGRYFLEMHQDHP